ncbi:hypothetical protein CXB51_001646 [Gossypium anomalum]|uniref:Dirigent protein n=1 Tax=Gossypium anomalum TaxID=47600 RepID=A0A8J6DCK0_9ROSI|nr:hypothetical protein CXB51_001646 [Gossypium anomalum]
MYADFAFTSGRFDGSSFSLFSRNLSLDKVRELAIVGGRGTFRMARGPWTRGGCCHCEGTICNKSRAVGAKAAVMATTIAAHLGWRKIELDGQQSRAEKRNRLHFFLHDTLSGENPSAVMITHPNIIQTSSFKFGNLFAIDDPLTVEPEPTSTLIGNAQGLYVSSSRDHLISHLRVAGVHLLDAIHELAIVGGRGVLRMAKWFDLTQITFANLTACNVILECNVTLYHY